MKQVAEAKTDTLVGDRRASQSERCIANRSRRLGCAEHDLFVVDSLEQRQLLLRSFLGNPRLGRFREIVEFDVDQRARHPPCQRLAVSDHHHRTLVLGQRLGRDLRADAGGVSGADHQRRHRLTSAG